MKKKINVIFKLDWEKREDNMFFVTCPQVAFYSVIIPDTDEGQLIATDLLQQYLERNLHGINYEIYS